MASVSVKVHEVFCVVQHYFSSVCLSVAVPACGVRVPFAHLSTFSTVSSKANSVCVRQTHTHTHTQTHTLTHTHTHPHNNTHTHPHTHTHTHTLTHTHTHT